MSFPTNNWPSAAGNVLLQSSPSDPRGYVAKVGHYSLVALLSGSSGGTPLPTRSMGAGAQRMQGV